MKDLIDPAKVFLRSNLLQKAKEKKQRIASNLRPFQQ